MDLGGGVLLALAGFAAGAINAAAGGGSLVTFPALIAVGYPPLVANVTNNVAVSPVTPRAPGATARSSAASADGSCRLWHSARSAASWASV